MRGIFFWAGFFLVVLGACAWAQAPPSPSPISEGDGTGLSTSELSTSNSSPTPIGGFTFFQAACMSGSFAQSVVCTSSPCNLSTASLCQSSFSTYGLHSCSALAPLSNWGWNALTSACCDSSGVCVQQPTTHAWVVGVDSSSPITQSSYSLNADPRGFKIVRKNSSNWVVVFDTPTGAMLTSTTNAGSTWTSPFALKSLFGPASLPSGVAFGQVSVANPALVVRSDSSLVLAFEIVDNATPTPTSAIFSSTCVGSSCASLANWSPAAPVLPPLVTETNPGGPGSTWQFASTSPKLSAHTDGTVHLIFDDGQTGPLRIQGIFHRFCVLGDCSSTSDWSQPDLGPDVLNNINNGYPHSPHVAASSAGVFAVWLDYSSLNNPSSNSVFFSRYNVSNRTWSPPFILSSAGNFLFPWISASDSRVAVSSLNNSSVNVWDCSGGCLNSDAAWQDLSSTFSDFDSIQGKTEAAVVVSPFNSSELALFSSGQSSGVYQIFGAFTNGTLYAGPRKLMSSLASLSLAGMSDVKGAFARDANPLVQFLGATSEDGTIFSTEIFSFDNAPPSLALTLPLTPVVWQSFSASVYHQSTSFTISDPNSQNELYASVYFGAAPGSTTFLLRDRVNLSLIQGSTDQDTCSGTNGFTTQQTCTLDLPLYTLEEGLLAPDGIYYLTVVVADSSGATASASTSNTIVLDLSNTSLTILSPSPNSNFSGPTIRQLVSGFSSTKFSQSLKLTLLATLNSSTFSYTPFSVVAFGAVSSSCTKNGADYNCSFPFAPNPSLPEGVYTLLFSSQQDGFLGASAGVNNVALDYVGPRLTVSQPAGTVSNPPSSVSFTLDDFSNVNSVLVSINGNSISPSCTPVGTSSVCSAPMPSSISTGPVSVQITSSDDAGNVSSPSFSFTISEGTVPGGPTGPSSPGNSTPGIPNIKDLVDIDEAGNITIKGTPVVIPKYIVDTVGSFSNNVVLTASNLVDVTGPSANAIFLGLCVMAGLASDVVFRRVFSQIRAEMYKQRERLVRAVLAGIFFSIPLAVGWNFSLVAGFIFTVMEIVGFLAAAYIFKLIQYYDTFGYKTIQAASSGWQLFPPK